ncbi:MAG: 5'-deoxyadenosine deaminase [Myxococcota bacterium]|nr:5'-deoxyadenosine deaminase [Myxococcota bacterium]
MTAHEDGLDLVVRGGLVVTMDATRRVVAGDVLVRHGRIVAVGTVQPQRPARWLDARGCAVMPGFVQAHVHLCQTLMRGMADELPLLAWLRERIWPLEAAHDERSLRTSARLGLAELVAAGTTTILDMGTVRHHDVVFEEIERSGIRALGGKAMMDRGEGVPPALRETTAASLRESEALARRWHGRAGGRLRYAFAPRFVLSCSERLVRETVQLADEMGALVHTHAAEHAEERRAVREAFGEDDVAVLRRWGVRGPRAVLAHGVQLRDDEMRTLAEEGTRLVHCPSANLKLGSGIARLVAMRRAGLHVGLGADGAPCNNRLDPWTEMRTAALLAKAREGDARALPAMDALALATIDGARVLGLEAETGSIEPGKWADLVVVRIDRAHAEPGGDVASRLVYACSAADVRATIASGRIVYRAGEHDDALVDEARRRAPRLLRRAGMAG